MSEGEECTLTGVTVLKANHLGVALSLAFSLACVVGGSLAIAKFGLPQGKDGGAFLRLLFFGMMGGGFGAWWFSRVSRRPSDLAGELRATREGIFVRGQQLVSRREITRAFVSPAASHGTFVRIERKGVLSGPIDLKVKNVAEGRALLHALGLDATQSASNFSIAAISTKQRARRTIASILGLVAMVVAGVSAAIARRALGLPPGALGAIGVAGVIAYAVLLLQLLTPTKVVVGADGVLIRWLWQKRFVPIADIVSAEVVDGEPTSFNQSPILVRVHLRSGAPMDLFADVARSGPMAPSGLQRFARMRAEILAERINEAVAGRGESDASALAFDVGLLRRSDRAIDEWVSALRALRSNVQTFREPGVVLDQLWKVLEDVRATPEKRAAAAVVLSPHLDEGGRERLRVAAEATVAPKLRVALEAAAEDDDDRLRTALDDVVERREARAEDAPS